MKNHLTQLALALAVTLIFSMSQVHAATITTTIDDFGAGVPLSTFGTSTATNDGLHSDVLGGYRDTSVVVSSGGLNVYYSPVVGSTLAFDALGGSFGTYTSVYDGIGSGGSLNLDLLGISPYGIPNMEGVFTVFFDVQNGAGTVAVTVTDNNTVSYTLNKSINSASGYPYLTVVFDYADFVTAGVDLTDIQSIALGITGTTAAADFTIGSFNAVTNVVPEPASLSLLALGGLLLVRRRNRERLA